MNVVQITPNVVNFGTETEVFVTGLASIIRVSAGVVRECFYADCPNFESTKTERRLVLTVIWDAEEWYAARRARASADPRHIPPCLKETEGYELRH
jgi:hypothetical protein